MKANPISDVTAFFSLFMRGEFTLRRETHLPTSPTSRQDIRSGHPFLYIARSPAMQATGDAVRLTIQFRVHRLNLLQRHIIPLASIPFFAARPGFIDKQYLLHEDSLTLTGCYRWQDEAAIDEYLSSYAMRFMRLISLPGSLAYHIETAQGRTARPHKRRSHS